MIKTFALLLLLAVPAFAGPKTYVDPNYIAEPRVVQVEKLEKLATYIEKLAPKRLDMTSYSGDGDPDEPDSYGCAAFHAGATAMFRGEGFAPSNGRGSAPSYKGLATFIAVQVFFGLTEEDAAVLFGSRARPPSEEASMLRAVAARERARLARIERRGLCELAAW